MKNIRIAKVILYPMFAAFQFMLHIRTGIAIVIAAGLMGVAFLNLRRLLAEGRGVSDVER